MPETRITAPSLGGKVHQIKGDRRDVFSVRCLIPNRKETLKHIFYCYSASMETGWSTSVAELDPFWSSDSLEFIHDGAEATRLDKLALISKTQKHSITFAYATQTLIPPITVSNVRNTSYKP